METTTALTATSPELLSFVAGAQKLLSDYAAVYYPNNAKHYTTELIAEVGSRYARIVRQERSVAKGEITGRSGHCFIDLTNGDVLKSASWKSPAKGARGNVFDASNGLGRMGPYGTEYNR